MITRIKQEELDRIVIRHELFRQGRPGGARANLAHHDLTKLSLRGRDLSHADFTRSILYETDLAKAKLDYCLFFAADLRRANFREASLIRADLRGACMRGASMTGADLTDADLREGSFASYDPQKGLSITTESDAWKEGTGSVDLRGATLSSAKLSGMVAINSNFEDANLSKAVFIRGDLSGANLAGANLAGADLGNCVLKNVNMRGANLSGVLIDPSKLVNVDMTGALTDAPAGKTIDQMPVPIQDLLVLHKQWLDSKGAQGKRLDLSGFDMRKAPSLGKADLTMFHAENSIWYAQDMSRMIMAASRFDHSDLRSCNFDVSDLRGSSFVKANLAGAKLRHAHFEPLLIDTDRLVKTDFSGANLRYTDFAGSDLRDANFTGADLSFANLGGAKLQGAKFHDAKLVETHIDPDELNSKVTVVKETFVQE
jgi:uncharacterized protein YjbI with pentapeptide repeats